MTILRMGTRGSKLAIAQAETVARSLAEQNPGITVETVIIKTTGDINTSAPLYAMKDPGAFTREIEKALFDNKIDFAVHSLKDLPAYLPEGLALAPPTLAEDARECIIGDIRAGSVIGCGSPRRRFALSLFWQNFGALGSNAPSGGAQEFSALAGHDHKGDALERDVQECGVPNSRAGNVGRGEQNVRHKSQAPLIFADIRGNIPTRLEKLRQGQYDAIIMAHAAIKRLGLESLGLCHEDVRILDIEDMLPAPCQGILGLEYRAGDEKVRNILASIADDEANVRAQAERAFLQTLHLGCNTPASCFAKRLGLLVKVKASLAAVPAADNVSCVRCAETDDAQTSASAAGCSAAVSHSAANACYSGVICADAGTNANSMTCASASGAEAIMLETEIIMPCELAEDAGKLAAQTLLSGCQAHNLIPAPEPPVRTLHVRRLPLHSPRPLEGKTIAILRSNDEAEPFIKALGTLGANAFAYPVIRCEPLLEQELPQNLLAEFAENPQQFLAIAFASRRSPALAVKALGNKARELLAFCTGESTAASALECGYPQERIVVPVRHDAAGIIEAMLSYFGMSAAPCASDELASSSGELSVALGTSAPHKPAAADAPRIIITMPQGTDHLAQAAEKAGFLADRLPLYRTVPLTEAPPSAASPAPADAHALAPKPPAMATATSDQAPKTPASLSAVPDLIMAFSPSALESFFRLSNISPHSAHIAAIGKSTAAAAEKWGCADITVSPFPEPRHFLKTVFIHLASHK